jgi:voltage-gated potassium channel
METPASFRHLRRALLLVLGVLVLGTVGYMLIEQLSFVDALYTAISMMATVGLVAYPLSPFGRMFTIVVVILGVGSLLYTFGAGMEYIIEGNFSQAIRRQLMDKKIAALRNHYIICGFGRVGRKIAEDFNTARMPFVVIDEKEENIQSCIPQRYLALQGDATTDELLRHAGVQYAKCLLAATDNDAHNIYITLSARNLNNKLFIIARANHDETEAKLKLAGADRVISPYTIGGHRMANLAVQPGVIEFFDILTKAGNMELAIKEVALTTASPLLGHTVTEAQHTLSDDTIIVALKKPGGLVTTSRFQVRIEEGDSIIIVGVPEKLAAFQQKNRSKTD